MAHKGNIPWNKNKKGLQKSHRKGLTFEEEYGEEKARILKSGLSKPCKESTKIKIGIANSKDKIKIICKNCKKEFDVRPCCKNRTFCSIKCASTFNYYKKNSIIRKHFGNYIPREFKKCQYCEKLIHGTPCSISKRKFCSGLCANRFNNTQFETIKKIKITKRKLYKEGKIKNWNTGLTKETDERVKRNAEATSKTRKRKFESGELKTTEETRKIWSKNRKNVPLSEIHKQNMRIAHLEYVIKVGGPNIGKHEKQILDELEKSNGFKIDRQFKVIGYKVDGYIPELNLCIEVDEEGHFDIDGNLREKDVIRQKRIEEVLGCRFLRIKDIEN